MKNLAKGLTLAVGIGSLAGVADAATVSLVDSTGTKVNGTISYSGTDSDIRGFFGGSLDDLLASIYPAGNNGAESDLVETLAGLPADSLKLGGTELPGSNPGTMWSVPGSTYFTVKYGQALFVLFNTSASAIDVTYATAANCSSHFASNKCSNSVSHSKHITLEDVTPVPLPAAGWLMLAGLGGLAAWRRRAR